MIWVVTQYGRDKKTRKRVGKFDDDALADAVELAVNIVNHNRVSCFVLLRYRPGENALLLKKVYKNWLGKVRIR